MVELTEVGSSRGTKVRQAAINRQNIVLEFEPTGRCQDKVLERQVQQSSLEVRIVVQEEVKLLLNTGSDEKTASGGGDTIEFSGCQPDGASALPPIGSNVYRFIQMPNAW